MILSQIDTVWSRKSYILPLNLKFLREVVVLLVVLLTHQVAVRSFDGNCVWLHCNKKKIKRGNGKEEACQKHKNGNTADSK